MIACNLWEGLASSRYFCCFIISPAFIFSTFWAAAFLLIESPIIELAIALFGFG
jgi:hypothetical protein